MDRYEAVRSKIQRANQHVIELEDVLHTFFGTNPRPYSFSIKRDPDTRKPIYYVSKVATLPNNISLIVGDVIHNLRSALDHLAYHLVVVNNGKPSRDTGFPILKDVVKGKASLDLKVKGMRQTAIDAIWATKPYKGGNATLWALHELNNIDKHRFVITVLASLRHVDLSKQVKASMKRQGRWVDGFHDTFDFTFPVKPDAIVPLAIGETIYTGAADEEFDASIEFVPQVALAEPGVIQSQSLIQMLDGMGHHIGKILADFAPHLN